jgi:acyl-CoA reductase-like NAD-dependent aldehyde dehydrogenase
VTASLGDIFIDGDWRAARSQRRFPVINPATEEAIADVVDAEPDDVDAAVLAAYRALPAWRATPVEHRARYVLALADILTERGEAFARFITTENGAPISETRNAAAHGAAHLRFVANEAPLAFAEDIRANPLTRGRTLVKRVPHGVAGLITPWNFPLSLILIKLGPALMAGCTVVIKPAPETPMAARALMDAVQAAGFPAGTVNLVTGGVETGRALVNHPLVRKISFTGSTLAGRAVGEVCGRMLRPATLELGGKSAAIVLEDADPKVFAAHLLKVSLRNTGQTCKACTRLLVPEARAGEWTDLAANVVASAPIGDPFDDRTVFGPLAFRRHRDKVQDYIELGAREGARAVVGGGLKPPRDRGYFVQPTVFDRVDNQMRIAREEIFGPVLSILTYRSVDEAVHIANDSPYGLAGAVFGADPKATLAVAQRLETGNVGINQYGSNAAAPFSGHKDSGVGTECGLEGLASYLAYTSIHLET